MSGEWGGGDKTNQRRGGCICTMHGTSDSMLCIIYLHVFFSLYLPFFSHSLSLSLSLSPSLPPSLSPPPSLPLHPQVCDEKEQLTSELDKLKRRVASGSSEGGAASAGGEELTHLKAQNAALQKSLQGTNNK